MNDRAGPLIAGAVLSAFFAALALSEDTHTVIQQERSFHPAEVTIARGSTLDFSNQDEFIHQIYVDSPGFNYDSAEQQPGEVFHVHFPDAGTFPVRCHIHPKMLLTVHVQ